MAWALAAIVCQHLTVARVAEGLGVAWNTANDAVLAEGYRVLINDRPGSKVSPRSGSMNTCGATLGTAASTSR